jgi:hypothetical protein
MEDFDEYPERNDVILKLVKYILNMSDEQRLDLLYKIEEVPLDELTLGERDEVRKPFDQSISFYVQNRRYKAICKDISSGGIFIQTHEVFHVGQIVTLDIPFSSADQSIKVPAEIVRADSEGIGLRFIKKEKVTYI